MRPNVNVYFIAVPGRAAIVRVALGRVLADTRRELQSEGVDLAIDCHPYTISQRDPVWIERPLLTLTTKVFGGEYESERFHVSSTIGLGNDVLDRNHPRLGELVGKDVPTGWQSTAEARRIIGLRKANAGSYYRTRGVHA